MFRWSILFLFLAASCAPKVIHFTNDDQLGNFSSYVLLNFKVGDRQTSPEGRQLISLIERKLQEEMSLKGYRRVTAEEPDLLLRYELVATRRTRTDVNPVPFSAYSTVNTRVFQESILLVELTNRKNRKLVWQGSVDLKQYAKKNKANEALEKAIVSIFETFNHPGKSTNIQ